MKERLERLMEALPDDIDGVILTAPIHRRYYLNIVSSAGTLLLTRKEAYFIVDFRYIEMAKDRIKGCKVMLQENLESQLGELIGELGLNRIGIDVRHITLKSFEEYQRMARGHLLSDERVEELISKQRSRKNEEEIHKTKKAKEIIDRVYQRIIPYIRPGVRDDELQRRLGILASEEGSQRGSFGFTVSFGDNFEESDSLPDIILSGKVLRDGDLLTLRLASLYEGYWAEMSRTVCVGRATEEQKRLYDRAARIKKCAMKLLKEGEPVSVIEGLMKGIDGEGNLNPKKMFYGIGMELEEPVYCEDGVHNTLDNMILCVCVKVGISGKCSVTIRDMVVVKEGTPYFLGEESGFWLKEV